MIEGLRSRSNLGTGAGWMVHTFIERLSVCFGVNLDMSNVNEGSVLSSLLCALLVVPLTNIPLCSSGIHLTDGTDFSTRRTVPSCCKALCDFVILINESSASFARFRGRADSQIGNHHLSSHIMPNVTRYDTIPMIRNPDQLNSQHKMQPADKREKG